MSLKQRLQRFKLENDYWDQPAPLLWRLLLLPLSGLFRLIVGLRKWAYRLRIMRSYQFNVPIIVVGNITLGGTGKTPFVIWLANFLREQGFQPGIVSRGYGGLSRKQTHFVTELDEPASVGDEACLIKKNTSCPLGINIHRVQAVDALIKQKKCNIIISDDGLQHYKMRRNMEVIMVDGLRQFGNGYMLPAGPLREPVKRLQEADMVIVNHTASEHFQFKPYQFIHLRDQRDLALNAFPAKKVHAVAAIGNPQRFFTLLQQLGFDIITHIFPDHHLYQKNDFAFADEYPVIMTEKDAVKCESFADERFWYLAMQVTVSQHIKQTILNKLNMIGVIA